MRMLEYAMKRGRSCFLLTTNSQPFLSEYTLSQPDVTLA